MAPAKRYLASPGKRHVSSSLAFAKVLHARELDDLVVPGIDHSIAVLETEVLGLRFLNDVNQSAESFSLASTSGLLMNADE